MHEFSICRAFVTKVEEIARQRAARATQVRVAIGPLSGVEPKLVRQAYPLVCAGTLVEGARLVIEETVLRVRCRQCNAESAAEPNRLLCGACGDGRTEVVSGDEMMLLQVELEISEPEFEAHHV